MKRIITVFLALVICFSLVACGSSNTNSETSTNDTLVYNTGADTEHNSLVIYFSLTGEQYEVGEITKGNTQIVAEIIAEETGADLFAIQPVKEYPNDYNRKLEEATSERENDERPEIANQIENFDEYDTIFIGYPKL